MTVRSRVRRSYTSVSIARVTKLKSQFTLVGAHLDTLEITADLVPIPIFGSVKEVLDDSVLVVKFTKGIGDYRSS